ncbi:MAG: hypothetical protein LUF28_01940 [Clostridiales bacterium]|nr:hypothetical protein [Clostridiales bacterium]
MCNKNALRGSRIVCLLAAALAICILLSGCSGAVSNADDVKSDFSLTLPASASSEVLIESHGGFHGDGVTLIRYTFSQEDYDALVAQAQDGGDWQAVGPDGQLSDILLIDESEGFWAQNLPADGYWMYAGTPALDSTEEIYSYNFSVLVLDTDAEALYYYALDT